MNTLGVEYGLEKFPSLPISEFIEIPNVLKIEKQKQMIMES